MILKEGDTSFNPKMEVVGCFCCSEDQFVVLLRAPDKPQPNTYGLPGGKVEKGESLEEAVRREVYEETRMKFINDRIHYLGKVLVRYENGDFVYHVYRGDVVDKNELGIDINQHRGYVWVTSKQAKSLPLIEDLDIGIDMFYEQ